MLRAFWQKHPEAESVLREWHSVVEHVAFRDFHHVLEFFNSADYVPPYTVFNVGGNKYRLVVKINYPYGTVYIRFIGPHAEYDRIHAEEI